MAHNAEEPRANGPVQVIAPQKLVRSGEKTRAKPHFGVLYMSISKKVAHAWPGI
jgi:hypothetical protein